jgi:FkbM family methyltransferase
MNLRKMAFRLIGETVRRLPMFRGKVAIGNYFYKFFVRRGATPFAVETTLFPEKLIFRLDLDCAHERMAYLMGQYEQETAAFLIDLWHGGSFLDVGANIGLISLPIAARLKARTNSPCSFIYAVEAMPSNFLALCTNISLNKLDRLIVPINIGVGAEEGETSIQIEGDDAERTGTANVLPTGSGHSVPLKIRPIDLLVAQKQLPGDIALIKIDTDGYDFEVLKGAQKLLRENRPLIYAELDEHCLSWHGYGINDVRAYLDGIDYYVWPMKSFSPPSFNSMVTPEYKMNCLVVPKERANDLAHYLIS